MNLLPKAMRRRRLDRWTVVNAALALVMVISIAAGLGWILHNRAVATDVLANRVEREATQARQTAVLQEQIDVLTAAMQAADATGQRAVPFTSLNSSNASRRYLPRSNEPLVRCWIRCSTHISNADSNYRNRRI